MLAKYSRAVWNSVTDWKHLIYPIITMVLVFYPELREFAEGSLKMELPDVGRGALIVIAILAILIIAAWRRLVLLENKLDPKLVLTFNPQDKGCVHHTLLGEKVKTLFVRVLPVCESRVSNCVGFLSGVYKLSRGSWEKTNFDERLDLTWGNRDGNPVPIQHGIHQYLDVFCIPETVNQIVPCTANSKIPSRAKDVFNSATVFKIDVGVMGDNNAFATVSLKVEMGETWDKAKIEQLPSN